MNSWLGRLHEHDERILHSLVMRRGRMADVIMRTVTHLGDAVTTVGITVLLISGVIETLAPVGGHAATALVVSHLAVQLLKRTMSRERPTLPMGYESLVRAPDRFSFPSGHSAAAASVAIPLALVVPAPAGFMIIGLATLVGFSRCYLGVHYPGDVIVGWLLGILGVVIAGLML